MNRHARNLRAWALASLGAILVTGLVGCATVPTNCGCGVAAGCGVGCAVDPGCGCEPGCAVDPGCGCATPCGGGCSMAGQMWCGDCGCGPCKPLINVCTGPDCCGGCDPGCGMEPGCGCEPGCAVDPGCGCEPSCGVGGCGSACGAGCGCRVGENLAFGVRCIGSEFRRLLAPLGLACPNRGCGGCGDLYWHEWHSDPPVCCDPCDDCGNWVGPSASMTAPYDHEFAPRRVARLPGESGQMLR